MHFQITLLPTSKIDFFLLFLGWLYDITGTYDLSFYLAGLFIAISGAILLIVPLIGFLRNFFKAAPEKEAPKDISGINSV